jgi:tetratricopeptide (TPR) repeat protein
MNFAIVNNPASAIQMGLSLLWSWKFCDRMQEQYGWASRLLPLTETWPPGTLRVMMLRYAGYTMEQTSYNHSGLILLEESVEMAKTIGEKDQISAGLNLILRSQSDWFHDNSQELRPYAEQLLALSRELGSTDDIAFASWLLGRAAIDQGDKESGIFLFNHSLALSRQENFPYYLSFVLFSLGNLANLDEDYPRAEAFFRECVQIRRQVNFKIGLASALDRLGEIMLAKGDADKAWALFIESLEIWQVVDVSVSCQIFVLAGFAGITGVTGRVECAARLFGATEAAFERYNAKFDSILSKIYNPIIDAVHERLGETEFNRLWAEGRKLTLEQALELARQ